MTDAFRNQRVPYVQPSKTPKPSKPKVTAVPKVKKPTLTQDQLATRNAMSTFQTALAQLKASQAPVDSAAIYAPYRASEQVVGQMGQGLQSAVQGVGQAAQAQYAQGRDAAQQHAAQFGISAGAGADPTALQDTGTQALAEKTQAYAAAAPQAATAWQQLLERTAAAKVAGANQDRTNTINQGSASLSTNLPSLIGDEKTKLAQAHAQKFNEGLARTQLNQKGKDSLRNYLLGVKKATVDAGHKKTQDEIDRDRLDQKTSSDAAKLKLGQDTLALKKRSTTAKNTGLKGIDAAVKALSGSTSGGGSKRAAKGWDVTYQVIDPDTGDVTDTKTIHMPSKKAPPGGKLVSATTHYESVPSSATTSGVTQKQWDTQMRALIAQNPGKAKQVKAFLGPRPKK